MNFETLDALWKARHDAENARDLNRLLEAYSRETTALDARFELDWRRARCAHFAAMHLLENGETKTARAEFERGADLAQWTLSGPQERVEGRFWWAVNFLETGHLGTKWAAFWALRGARAHLKNVARLDETFHFAGPLRVLGRVTHLAPKTAGGDAQKSRQFFERALAISANSTTRLYFGELLRDVGETDAANAQFDAILSAPDDENWMWEQARDRDKARTHREISAG